MEDCWEMEHIDMKDGNTYKHESTLADTQPGRTHRNDVGADRRERLESLLHQARTARDGDAAMEYVQSAVDLGPDDPRVQSSVQLSVFSKLSADAFVAFLAETGNRYVITFRNSRPFTVPKARNEPEPYPPARRTDAERALGMMWWMIIGLIPAGLGAVILSPFAISRAIRSLQRDYPDPRQHRTAWIAIFVALGLGLLGIFFGALLLLHLYIG